MGILSERAMLATFSVSKWSGAKLDQSATRELNNSHGAVPDAAKVRKRLLPKTALKKIDQIAAEARGMHYDKTMPWLQEGPRILASGLFMEVSTAHQGYQTKFDAAVREFLAEYEAYKSAATMELGSLYSESDYPTSEQLQSKFQYRVAFDTVPDGDDFRVALGDEHVKRIKADIEARQAEAMEVAIKSVWSRVHKVADHMAEKLTEYKPSGKSAKAEGIFRDTLVSNVRELVEILPALNISGSNELAEIAHKMRADLCHFDPDELRESEALRKRVAASSKTIAEVAQGYLA